MKYSYLILLIIFSFIPDIIYSHDNLSLNHYDNYIDIIYNYSEDSSVYYTSKEGYIFPQYAFALAVPPAESYYIEHISHDIMDIDHDFQWFAPDENFQIPSSSDNIILDNILDDILIVNTGTIRFQNLISINIRPIVLNYGQAHLFHNLHLRIHFNGIKSEKIRDVYEKNDFNHLWEDTLQKTLINYNEGRKWRLRRDQTRSINYPFELIEGSPITKISIQEEGLYRITYEDLFDLGIDPAMVDPYTIQIFHRGEEIPLLIQGIDTDFFTPSHKVLFYAGGAERVGYSRNILTEYDHYFLLFNREEGLRYQQYDAYTEEPHNTNTYRTSSLFERNNIHDIYYLYYRNPMGDNFFWTRIDAPATRSFMFLLEDFLRPVFFSKNFPAPVNIKFKLYLSGVTSLDVDPDHHFKVWLNDNLIMDEYFDGRVSKLFTKNIPVRFLNTGTNTLRIQAVGDTTPNNIDSIYLNWFEFVYNARYNMRRGSLGFSNPHSFLSMDYPVFKINNIDNSDIILLDISNGIKFSDLNINYNTVNSRYELIFKDNNDHSREPYYYLAITDSIKPVPFMKIIEYDNILDYDNRAHLLIIYHNEFLSAIDLMKNFYESQGFEISTVDIYDIYNIFANGSISIFSIRDFLYYVLHNWEKAPSHVILFGGATYDPMFILSNSFKDQYIPSWGEPANDFYYASVYDDDDFLDYYLTRIPAQSEADAINYVNKSINYASNPFHSPWEKKTLFINGGFNSSEQTIFDYQTNQIIDDFICPNMRDNDYSECNVIIVSKTTTGCNWGEYSHIINDILHSGVAVINFFGHAGSMTWDCMYSTDDVVNLSNSPRLPLIFSNTCFTAAFDNPSLFSLSELFTTYQPDGGGIAFVGQSLLAYMWGSFYLARDFYKEIYDHRELNIGKTITDARIRFLINYPEYTGLYHMTNVIGDGFNNLRLRFE